MVFDRLISREQLRPRYGEGWRSPERSGGTELPNTTLQEIGHGTDAKSNSPQPNRMLATIVRQFEPSRLERQTLKRIFELVCSPSEDGTKSRLLNEVVAVEQAARRDSMARTGRRGGQR